MTNVQKISSVLLGLGLTIGFASFLPGDGTDPPAEETRTDVSSVAHGPLEMPSRLGDPATLPLPHSLAVAKYEQKLFDFLNSRKYVELGWLKDKRVRDTGPYIDGKYYGTHPAVRVFYSPEIVRWLVAGRKGTIPDGAMIIKEQYEEPAVRHNEKTEQQLRDSLKSWTVMVKDSAGSFDGWYWANPGADQQVTDNHQWPFDHPLTGFGHYCVRCHAATQSPGALPADKHNEFTFIAARNIEGFPGEPIIFRVDDSWRHDEESHPIDPENEEKLAAVAAKPDEKSNMEDDATAASDPAEKHPIETKFDGELDLIQHDSHPQCTQTSPPERCQLVQNKPFLKLFDQIGEQDHDKILRIPPVTHDWVISDASGERPFVTSNQCMSCHAGLVAPFGPSMFIPEDEENTGYGEPGWHVSPYGEWRWTPMGLAGRDPIFYSQLESEIEILKKQFAKSPDKAELVAENLVDTCLRCHGAMGKRQFNLDHGNIDGIGVQEKFTLDHVYATAGPDEHIGHGDSHYGALARDGISCVICHRSQPRPQPEDDDRPYLQYFLESSITGNVYFGDSKEIYGPFKDDEIAPYVMEHATGIKPKHSPYIQSSQMCGTCHTVNLPVVDHPFHDDKPDEHQQQLVNAQPNELFKGFHHHVEQATYLEWLNSEYENEINTANPNARTCQQCHMKQGLASPEHGIDIAQIRTRIAAVQDATYPDAENLTSHENLNIRIRDEGYRRHNFSGLNVFLLELFNQYDDILGVRKHDFMTGSKQDLQHSIENMLQQARQETANVSVTAKATGDRQIEAEVLIENKAGHRFPSGVGFRRAFIELLVIENAGGDDEKIVWSSGRTNSLGVIVGPDNQPLPTEFFERLAPAQEQVYQPHHQTITSQEQVQIYETLLQTFNRKFTTSFIHGCYVIKENRLLPRGWKAEGPDPEVLTGEFLKATHPGEAAAKDPRYVDGSGSDATTYRIDLPPEVDSADITIRASLYYQAIPPYFLKNLFDNAPDGPATQRLHYMLANANLEETVIENWKLLVQSSETGVSE